MNNKKFILNADDFGLNKEINRAVVEAYNNGFLKSASLCANGEAFDSAINEIMPECHNLCVGVHLNIIEGKALNSFEKINLLVNSEGIFNNGFVSLLLKSNDKTFLAQVELEFRSQIEKIMQQTNVIHIDSHVHTHAIPNLFKLTCKLAKEYNIPFVRTQFEQPYLIPDIFKHTNFKYPVNIIKIALLNYFSIKNKQILKEYNLKTNDYLIGVGYTGLMDDSAVEYGLKAVTDEAVLVESLIHPFYSEIKHSKEFNLAKNSELKYKISKLGFEITNYKELEKNEYEKI